MKLEPYTPKFDVEIKEVTPQLEVVKAKFKVGDRVKVVTYKEGTLILTVHPLGSVGTVISIHQDVNQIGTMYERYVKLDVTPPYVAGICEYCLDLYYEGAK